MSASRELEQERRLNLLDRRLKLAEDRIAEASQAIPRILAGGGGGDGSASRSYWCRTSASVAAATGTWPSLSPATFTADVYVSDGGALVQAATGATIYWWYKDTAAANKLVGLVPNGDGTYDARHDSCTAV
jgi:hypothetical protein